MKVELSWVNVWYRFGVRTWLCRLRGHPVDDLHETRAGTVRCNRCRLAVRHGQRVTDFK